MRRNVTLQLLRFTARVGNLDADVLDRAPSSGQSVLAVVDLVADVPLRARDVFDFFATAGEISGKRTELLFRVVCLEHAQIGMERLVTARFARLALERADLALYFFDHIADAQHVRFGDRKSTRLNSSHLGISYA